MGLLGLQMEKRKMVSFRKAVSDLGGVFLDLKEVRDWCS